MERPKTLGTIVFDAVVYCLRETKKRSLSMRRVIHHQSRRGRRDEQLLSLRLAGNDPRRSDHI